jgi:guanylate kinase
MAGQRRGRVIVISGPSGVGKTTIIERLFACAPVPLKASVSATTRAPRPGEVDGVHYHFLAAEEFCRRRQRGEFLECFQVFNHGVWYGTLRSEVAPSLSEGKWVVLSIDVHGAQRVVAQHPDAVTIFLRPSSLEVLEQRLRGRGTETDEALRRRLDQAQEELALADRYRYQVVNDDIDQAVQEICDILQSESGE